MKEKSSNRLLYPIFCSASGMILGFITFLITGNFIFLIVFITIGMTLGIARNQQKSN